MATNIIAQHIAELLYQQQRVTVPGIGTFYTGYKPAAIDHVHGEILPPTSTLYFDNELQENDGVLLQRLQVIIGATASDVQSALDLFVKDVQLSLDRKETVVFPYIGVMQRNFRQEIDFQPDTQVNYNTQAYGLPILKIQKNNSNLSTLESIPSEAAQPQLLQKLNNTPSHWDNLSATLTSLPALIALLVLVISVIIFSWVRTNENTLAEKQNINEKPAMDHAGILTDALQDDNEIATIDESELNEDTDLSDVLQTEAETAPHSSNNTEVSTTANNDYNANAMCTIIVGQFSDNNNAKRVARRLSKMGYTPITEAAGVVTRVGARFDCSQHDVTATLNLMRQTFDANAFIQNR
ncbi:MAG: hypothetical protein KA974_05530 [Saprospiraceae bacterium]|nr:hypothetical protein [Saprospiraceae bacterium]MBP7699409.1 hypothetical protein [Saprospiraceae bacterium]